MSGAVIERLNSELVVPELEWNEFLGGLGWNMEQVLRSELPPGITSLAELQLGCINNDGYLWSQFFLEEPEDDSPWGQKAPWNFFGYQIPAIRWNDSFIMYTAAKVGKTRHLIAKGLERGCNNPMGSGLIGAPESDQLVPIYEGMMEQLEGSPMLRGMLKSTRKQPHMDINLTNGFKIWFRPGKFDGRTFRGKHPKTFGYLDEAAKLHANMIMSEFMRALGPHCAFGPVSVPDGRRDTPFYRFGRIAKAQASGKKIEDKELAKDMAGRFLKLFHWQTADMPEEFSNSDRMKTLEQDYGGITNQRYIHNVLGEDGDPESTVFPSENFQGVVKSIPEYRCIQIKVNEKSRQVAVKVYRMEGEQQVFIQQDTLDLDNFNIKGLINRYLISSADIAEYFMGGDLGYSTDFAEFWVKAVIGERNRLVARVQMLGVKYNFMREVWDLMDDIYDRGRDSMKSGVDIGGAGTAFYHELVAAYGDKHYEERCIPVQFGGKADELMPDGSPMLDKNTEKPIRRRVKTLATKMIEKRIQDLTSEYPADPDIISDFTGHTCISGSDGDQIYDKSKDHTIDADRAGTWAYYRQFEEEFDLSDIATSGVPMEAVGAITGGGAGGIFLTGNGGSW